MTDDVQTLKRQVTFLRGVVAAVACMVVLAMLLGQVPLKPPGAEPYVPSKIEWFVVAMNSMFRSDYYALRGYAVVFSHDVTRPATVVIVALYDADRVDRAAMTSTIEAAKAGAEKAKDKFGFDWLKIEARMTQLEPPRPPLRP